MHFRTALIALTLVTAQITVGPALSAGSDGSGSEQPATADLAHVKDLLKAKDYAAAAEELADLAKADQGNADVWNLLGFAQRKSGDLKAAGKSYGKALKLNPNHIGALEYQGELFVMKGDFVKAKGNLEKLRGLCGDCEEAEDLAEALEKAGA